MLIVAITSLVIIVINAVSTVVITGGFVVVVVVIVSSGVVHAAMMMASMVPSVFSALLMPVPVMVMVDDAVVADAAAPSATCSASPATRKGRVSNAEDK